MRVLHFIYDDPSNPWVGGGAALRAHELYRRLGDELEATIVTGRYPGAREGTIDGVRYRRLGVSRPYALSRLSYAAAANRLLRAAPYDAALFDFSGYTPIALPTDRRCGIVVHMLHGPDAPDRWGRLTGSAVASLERWMLRRGRYVCVTSDWLAGRLRPLLPSTSRVSLVRSGVDDAFFQVQRRERDYLLYYGRFDVYQKGLDDLLAAFATLATRFPSLALRLVGRGRDAGRLGDMIAAHDMTSRVSVVDRPSREQVLSEMAGARLLLHPSRFEGLPMVPAEAMAAGVPVIASDVGGVREVVQPPDGGVLIPPGDRGALIEAAGQLLADDAARAASSSGARQAAERFRWRTVATDHLAFLRAVAG